jgi:hypothetical protein
MEGPEFILMLLSILLPAGLIFYILRRAFSLREKRLDIEALHAAEKAAQYVAHSKDMEARLAVMERIVTDQPTMLAQEIDRLAIDKRGNA